jgi:hypothetical protein
MPSSMSYNIYVITVTISLRLIHMKTKYQNYNKLYVSVSIVDIKCITDMHHFTIYNHY